MDIHSSTGIEVDVHDLHGKRFHTREELFEDVKSCFVSKGYAISIKNSKKDEYVTIGCDRGGVYRSKSKNPLESLKKETSTRLINCPFKIQGKRKSDGLWTLDLINISHNHDPSKDMAGHPSCRRLTKSETSEVERLSIAGIQPRNILSSLRLKNPNIQAVSRTLYNRASSRAEGAHAKLKGYLQVSTGDFAQVVSKICLAIDNEFQEINTVLESERIRVPHRCRISQFKFLLNCVSHFALGHLFKQYEMAKFGTLKASCSGHFTATMGLPCAHMMNQAKESSLVLDSIDPQWRIDTTFLSTPDVGVQNEDDRIGGLCSKLLDKYQVVSMDEKKEIEEKLMLMLHASDPILLEPDIQTPKGRPPGALNKRKEPIRSTKRQPSEFEIVEASMTRTSKQKSTHRSDETPSVFGVSDSLELNQGSQLFGIDLNSYISPFDPLSLDSL